MIVPYGNRKPIQPGDDVWIMYRHHPIPAKVVRIERGQYVICNDIRGIEIGKRIIRNHIFHTRLDALRARHKVLMSACRAYAREATRIERLILEEDPGHNLDALVQESEGLKSNFAQG